jgi:DNA-binding LacI/PurR family transcriptional regulator
MRLFTCLVKHHPQPPCSVSDRIEAFLAVAAQLDIRVTVSYSVGREDAVGLEDIRTLSEGDDRATAVVAWSDRIAEHVCVRLVQLGVNVPGRVAVLGFDGIDHMSPPPFRLTTIRAPWAQVGMEATRILNALIAGDEVPALTLLPVEFYRGLTT